MFGKLLGGLGKAVKVAGPLAAGLGLGGPVGAVITVGGQIAGTFSKKAGKALEASSRGPSGPVHKVATPAVSTGTSMLIMLLLRQFGIELPEDTLTELLAVVSPLMHQLGHGAESAAKAR